MPTQYTKSVSLPPSLTHHAIGTAAVILRRTVGNIRKRNGKRDRKYSR